MKSTFTFFASLLLAAGLQAQVTNGLVGHLSFNGSTSPDIGNATPTVEGVALGPDQCNHADSALQVFGPGSDNHYGINDSLMAPDSDFTISFWVVTAGPSTDALQYTVTQRHNATGGEQRGFDCQITNNMEAIVVFRTVNAVSVGTLRSDSLAIVPNQWHNVIVTRQNNFFSLLLDGTVLDTATILGVNLDRYINIGSIKQPSMEVIRELNGSVDEVRLYNRAVTQAEIDTLAMPFDCSSPGPGTSVHSLPKAQEAAFTVFPNPAEGWVTVAQNGLGNAYVTIQNIAGATVASARLAEGQQRIALPQGAAGLYLVQLWGDNGLVASRKLLVLP